MKTVWAAVALMAAIALASLVCCRCFEHFAPQLPILGARQAQRGYDMSVVASYCECEKKCRRDPLCGAFAYEASDVGLDTCTLGTVESSVSTPSEPRAGAALVYVTDRCHPVPVA